MSKEKTQPKTNEKQSLTKKLTAPLKEITATFPINERKIIEASCEGKKIVDFEDKDYNKLAVALLGLQKITNVRFLMDEYAQDKFIEFLDDYYTDFTIAEIEQAVIQGDGQKYQIDNRHYGEWSISYITRMLDTYRNVRSRILDKYHDAEVKLIEKKDRESQPPLTIDEIQRQQYKISRGFVLSAFDNFKAGIPCIALDKAYDFLKHIGLLNLTEQRIAQYTERAKENLIIKGKKGTSRDKSVAEAINTAFPTKDEAQQSWKKPKLLASILEAALAVAKPTIENEMKALAVKGYFTDLVELESDLLLLILDTENQKVSQNIN